MVKTLENACPGLDSDRGQLFLQCRLHLLPPDGFKKFLAKPAFSDVLIQKAGNGFSKNWTDFSSGLGRAVYESRHI